MSDIGSWLESAGRTLLGEARIGSSSAQADQLLREHEAIELKCRVSLGTGSCIDKVLQGRSLCSGRVMLRHGLAETGSCWDEDLQGQ